MQKPRSPLAVVLPLVVALAVHLGVELVAEALLPGMPILLRVVVAVLWAELVGSAVRRLRR